MLRYTLRVRDLVHGTILFTETEEMVINHPFFQRLRQVRQNDIAFYVYPSLNTSRFEHVLGTCRVAGMMAENLTKSPKWQTYVLELKHQTGISSKEDFIQLARLYALLHDVGHLPLSHLFETAVGSSEEVVREWTGVSGFGKLHEGLGAMITQQLVEELSFHEHIRQALVRLMMEKAIPLSNQLSVVKSLVDSQIDADRTDFVRRDGTLAGGEYGNYDIRRLCDSVFIEQDERGWLNAYSEKALTSMEALLLDRYRTHVWIHFHHRVVAIKMFLHYLIRQALGAGLIMKEQFDPHNTSDFSLCDDVWLWSVLRNMHAAGETTQMIQRAVFFREKRNVLTLWKSRPTYHEMWGRVKKAARVTDIQMSFDTLYDEYISDYMGVRALRFETRFEPVGKTAIPLYSEGKKRLTGKDFKDESVLTSRLNEIAKGDPQDFIILVGRDVGMSAEKVKRQWVELTARWIRK